MSGFSEGNWPQNEGPEAAGRGAEGTEVPDEIARLMGAQTFDISAHKVEDFRASATRETAHALTFVVGKPGGAMQGLALLTKQDAHMRVKLVVRRDGKSTRFAPPTPEFAQPELASFLEPVHLVPCVDVTGAKHAAYLWPFRITAWDGYERIFSALAKLDDGGEGLYVRYMRGAGDAGNYEAVPFKLESHQQALWRSIHWPNAAEVPSLIESVPFETLLAENFNLKRAWRQAIKRKGSAA